jgi:hypothetical protein
VLVNSLLCVFMLVPGLVPLLGESSDDILLLLHLDANGLLLLPLFLLLLPLLLLLLPLLPDGVQLLQYFFILLIDAPDRDLLLIYLESAYCYLLFFPTQFLLHLL